jgi:chemotaxis protein CheC
LIDQPKLSKEDLKRLECLMALALQRALSALSSMLGSSFSVLEFEVVEAPLEEVSTLLGSPEAPAFGVYLYFYGQGGCQVVLLLPLDTVGNLLELLLGSRAEDIAALDDLQVSALSEMGNVMAGSFVGHLADLLGLEVPCVPPAVVADMGGAILHEVVLYSEWHSDGVLMAKALFGEGGRELSGVFLVVPSPALLAQMRERCS